MHQKKERNLKDKPGRRQNTPNKSVIASSAYQEIKTVVDRIIDQKNRHKELNRPRNSMPNNTQIIRSYIHQPIMNNFFLLNNSPPEKSISLKKELTKRTFNYRYILGKGGFGKVWKVEHTKKKKQYAMKEMLKSMYTKSKLEF